MINDTYQEKKEAAAKLQGAQLPSCQLPTYFAGGEAGWRRVTDISRNGALHSRSGISTNSFEGRCFSGQTLEVPRPHQKEAF